MNITVKSTLIALFVGMVLGMIATATYHRSIGYTQTKQSVVAPIEEPKRRYEIHTPVNRYYCSDYSWNSARTCIYCDEITICGSFTITPTKP